MIDVTQIAVALIGLISIIITVLIAPLIQSKTTASQWSNIVDWTSTAVQAAEAIYKGAGRGEEKRNYVISWVSEKAKRHNIKIDEQSIRIALEDAWRWVQQTSSRENKVTEHEVKEE